MQKVSQGCGDSTVIWVMTLSGSKMHLCMRQMKDQKDVRDIVSIHSACEIHFIRCCGDLHLISLQVLPVKVHICFGLLIWKPGLSVRQAE